MKNPETSYAQLLHFVVHIARSRNSQELGKDVNLAEEVEFNDRMIRRARRLTGERYNSKGENDEPRV